MITGYAKIVSYVFEPLLVLILMAFALVIGQAPSDALSAAVFLGLGLAAPAFLYIYDYVTDRDDNVDPTRRERNSMYLAAVFGYGLTSILFGSVLVNNEFWFSLPMLMMIYFATFYVVNLYFDKASLHIGTFTFAIVVLTAKLSAGFALLLALLPIVVWSRLSLHKHQWVEIMWGLVIGLAVGLLAWAL